MITYNPIFKTVSENPSQSKDIPLPSVLLHFQQNCEEKDSQVCNPFISSSSAASQETIVKDIEDGSTQKIFSTHGLQLGNWKQDTSSSLAAEGTTHLKSSAGPFGLPYRSQQIGCSLSQQSALPSLPEPSDTLVSRCASEKQKEIPLIRFKRRDVLPVTSFSSQLWCEKQFEYQLSTGIRRDTVEMKKGVIRHEELERQDHIIRDVEVTTMEEFLALRLYSSALLLEQLLQKGTCREVWIFGIFEGICLSGIVDEMQIREINSCEKKFVVITDTKTRKQMKDPSLLQKRTSSLQLQLYFAILHHLSKNIVDYNKLLEIYNCNSTSSFTIKELQPFQNLLGVIDFFKSVVTSLPPIHEVMEIAYEHNRVEFSRCLVTYNEASVFYTLEKLLEWWFGEREALYVPSNESFKCKSCEYLSLCDGTPLSETQKSEVLRKREYLQESLSLQAAFDDFAVKMGQMHADMKEDLKLLCNLLDKPPDVSVASLSDTRLYSEYEDAPSYSCSQDKLSFIPLSQEEHHFPASVQPGRMPSPASLTPKAKLTNKLHTTDCTQSRQIQQNKKSIVIEQRDTSVSMRMSQSHDCNTKVSPMKTTFPSLIL